MTKVRIMIASVLLALAALVTPAVAGASEHTTQAQDIGWSITAAPSADEPSAGESPATTDVAPGDIGWG